MSDVAKLSDEEFDKQFEEMMSTPVEDTEEEIVEEPVEQEPEEEVEQPNETEEEVEEEESEEDQTEEPTEESEEEESITEPETEDVVEPFAFDKIPMDEVLPVDIPVNGTKVRATMNELMSGFKQGMNYTQKMQELAPMRKSLNIMKENDLSESDLNLLVEAKQGNKQALAKLIGDAGVDSVDLEPEEAKDYVPNNYGSEPASFEMEQVKNEINADIENLPAVERALDTMPESFFEEIKGNPSNLKALHMDVSSGAYDSIMPEMNKLSALEGERPSIELYKRAAQNLAMREPVVQERKKAPVRQADPVREAARQDKRNSAVSGTKRKTPAKESFVNFDDLDDSDFEKEFQKMTGRTVSDYR